MTNGSNSATQSPPELPTWATRGPKVVLVVGVLFYFSILIFEERSGTTFWGTLGDSVAPFAALLNACALFAVLYSTTLQRDALTIQQKELRLQRKELKLQRAELKLSRGVMQAQKEELQDSAKAQRDLVNAQGEANRLMESLQREQIAISLEAEIGRIALAMASDRANWGGGYVEQLRKEMPDRIKALNDHLHVVRARMAQSNDGASK